jgi:hypothetical protein
MNTTNSKVMLVKLAMLFSLACLINLTGCMSTENPRNFDETGKLTEATVYDVSQTPRVPLADAWVVVEYWYVHASGIVEATDRCRVSYSLKSDEMGKVRFPERTKHTVKINAYKPGYAYKTARIKPPYEVSLQPATTRAEEFLRSLGGGRNPYCERTGNVQTNLERMRFFYEIAKREVDPNNADEMSRLQSFSETLAEKEAHNANR